MQRHASLRLVAHVEPAFQENAYVLWIGGAAEAWIIDPGLSPQAASIRETLRKHGLTPTAIVLTHCHVDHIAGIEEVRASYPALPIIAPRDEVDMLADPALNLSAAIGEAIVAPEADQTLAAGESIRLGGLEFSVLDVAGHSPGGLAYYSAAAGIVISGDALFAGGIGRTDFPGSSLKRLLHNIRTHLFALPDDTVVYSGHGSVTTIGRERISNPFAGERARFHA